MPIVGQPASSIEVWDEGTYPATIAEMTIESAEESKYGKGRFKWVFRVRREVGGEVETSDIWYWTNQTLSDHKLATFRPLVRVVLPDVDLNDPDAQVNTDHLIGQPCRVILGVDEEKGRNRIDKILPAQARPQQARQPVAAARTTTDLADVPF